VRVQDSYLPSFRTRASYPKRTTCLQLGGKTAEQTAGERGFGEVHQLRLRKY